MITGQVRGNTPLVEITLRDLQGIERTIEAVVDTGCAFPLTLPDDLFEEFGFGHLRYVVIELADESERTTPALDIQLVEFGALSREVVLLRGKPLLGMGYLKGYRVTIDAVEGGTVAIEPLGLSDDSKE